MKIIFLLRWNREYKLIYYMFNMRLKMFLDKENGKISCAFFSFSGNFSNISFYTCTADLFRHFDKVTLIFMR